MSEEKNIKAPQKQGNTGGGMHGMGDVPEKPKDLKQSLTKLIEFCKSYLPAMIFALVTAAIGTVFQIIGPDKIKDLINEISKGITVSIDLDAVFRIGMLLVFFYGAFAILSFLQSFIMATATQRISKDLRTEISQKINKLPFKYFDKVSMAMY